MNETELLKDEHKLSELQKRLLFMLEWFHCYCKENGLRYYIIEGTVIGAARHQGFIPWDDDVDVGMPRKDYNRLIYMFPKRIGNYVLETPFSKDERFLYPWCKLFDTSTTRIEKARHQYRLGIYIDVFPLDGLGDTKEESIKHYRKIDFLNMLWATRVCAIRRERGIIKNSAIVLSRLIPQCVINDKKLIKKIDKECQKTDFDSSKYVSCTLSTYRTKEIMLQSIYGKPTEYPFESIVVYGPENMDSYLQTIYGKWWILPPKEKRVSQHDYQYLNLNESYLSKEEIE